VSSDILPPILANDTKTLTNKLHKLNKDLLFSVYFGTNDLTIADLALYTSLYSTMLIWDDTTRFQFSNITRWFDFMQNHEEFRGMPESLPMITINKNPPQELQQKKEVFDEQKEKVVDEQKPKVVDEQKPKEPESKKEAPNKALSQEPKKQPQKEAPVKKAAKGQKGEPGKDEETLDVSRLDIRVGKIITCKKHEAADTLYVEEIDLGEGKPRTVVSGLVKFIPLDQMQNHDVIVLCNLKPSNLKGIKSEAMVLAASNHDHTQVELLTPPPGSRIGERLTFDAYPGQPDEQLNPKKKIWETVQPFLHTNENRVAFYKDAPFKTSTGIVTVKSITNGTIK